MALPPASLAASAAETAGQAGRVALPFVRPRFFLGGLPPPATSSAGRLMAALTGTGTWPACWVVIAAAIADMVWACEL